MFQTSKFFSEAAIDFGDGNWWHAGCITFSVAAVLLVACHVLERTHDGSFMSLVDLPWTTETDGDRNQGAPPYPKSLPRGWQIC